MSCTGAVEAQMQTFSDRYLSDLSDYETNVVIGNPADQILELVNELTINHKEGKDKT